MNILKDRILEKEETIPGGNISSVHFCYICGKVDTIKTPAPYI
jgi:hypothetical protein